MGQTLATDRIEPDKGTNVPPTPQAAEDDEDSVEQKDVNKDGPLQPPDVKGPNDSNENLQQPNEIEDNIVFVTPHGDTIDVAREKGGVLDSLLHITCSSIIKKQSDDLTLLREYELDTDRVYELLALSERTFASEKKPPPPDCYLSADISRSSYHHVFIAWHIPDDTAFGFRTTSNCHYAAQQVSGNALTLCLVLTRAIKCLRPMRKEHNNNTGQYDACYIPVAVDNDTKPGTFKAAQTCSREQSSYGELLVFEDTQLLPIADFRLETARKRLEDAVLEKTDVLNLSLQRDLELKAERYTTKDTIAEMINLNLNILTTDDARISEVLDISRRFLARCQGNVDPKRVRGYATARQLYMICFASIDKKYHTFISRTFSTGDVYCTIAREFNLVPTEIELTVSGYKVPRTSCAPFLDVLVHMSSIPEVFEQFHNLPLRILVHRSAAISSGSSIDLSDWRTNLVSADELRFTGQFEAVSQHHEAVIQDGKAYEAVCNFFNASKSRYHVVSKVVALQNDKLEDQFVLRSARLGAKNLARHSIIHVGGTRKKVKRRMEAFVARDEDITIFYLWHGTSVDNAKSIADNGFLNLNKTDKGYFGSGVYATPQAAYACNVYGKGVAILCKMVAKNVYPIVREDQKSILGATSGLKGSDVHYIPVVPKTARKNEKQFFALSSTKEHPLYDEFVVFDTRSIIPVYMVHYKTDVKLVSPPQRDRLTAPIFKNIRQRVAGFHYQEIQRIKTIEVPKEMKKIARIIEKGTTAIINDYKITAEKQLIFADMADSPEYKDTEAAKRLSIPFWLAHADGSPPEKPFVIKRKTPDLAYNQVAYLCVLDKNTGEWKRYNQAYIDFAKNEIEMVITKFKTFHLDITTQTLFYPDEKVSPEFNIQYSNEERMGDFHVMRGNRKYYPPASYKRTALRVDDFDEKYGDWNVAFHGTEFQYLNTIVDEGLKHRGCKPDLNARNTNAKFTEWAKNVYLTPSWKYATLYSRWLDTNNKHRSLADNGEIPSLLLQVRVKPKGFKVKGETIGFSRRENRRIDRHYKNSELEWQVSNPKDVVVYGILIRYFTKEELKEIWGEKTFEKWFSR